ncbi:unnamed protein product [Phytophthora lilii]|uniref:Unnamed protein product n=1 Tax=Phytophthora lilii TaxID=2077276 RepID=A0A9W6UBW6_9STRA|nr:unnamed protein product [Phytophthora lilii]
MVNSSINTDRVSQTDRNIQARPQTSYVDIDNTQQIADVGIDNTPRMLAAETNMKNLDTEDQVEARLWVKNLFNANSNWTNQSIDWVATEEKIRDIWYDGDSKSIDESSYMRLEDPLYHASLTRKRKLADPSEGDYADRTKKRLENSFEFDTSTSTSLDRKNRLLWSIFKNNAVLELTGLKTKIIPILKSMGKTSPMDMDKSGYVWIDGSLISVFVSEGVRTPFRLKPIVDTKSGVKANQNYYFSEPTAAKPFYIRNQENKAVSGKVFNDLMKTIRWMDTFNSLMTGFEDIERYVYENDDPPLIQNLKANLQLLN